VEDDRPILLGGKSELLPPHVSSGIMIVGNAHPGNGDIVCGIVPQRQYYFVMPYPVSYE